MARKLICQWRVSSALPSGLQVWFDPKTETVRLYELEPTTESGVLEVSETDDQIDIYDLEVDKNEIGDLPF